MSLIQYVQSLVRRARTRALQGDLLKQGPPDEIKPSDWAESLSDPTGFYLKCFRYFHTRLPAELREHRAYFTQARRGFGEDAFHVMWFLLFREFKPRTFLEIGVYRGQTISLAGLLQRHFGYQGETFGISPFAAVGDSTCDYRTDVDYYEDTLRNVAHFSLPKPNLLKAYSTDAPATKLILSREWDCIYIDGNHDYEVVLQDWSNCAKGIKTGGIIVLDDSGTTSAFRAPIFATAGIEGPSRLAKELDRAKFPEILQVGHNRVFQKK